MRRLFPSAVLFAGVLWIAWAAGVERLAAQQNGSAPAQSQNAAQEPDAPQPQSDATPAPGAANAPDAPQPQNNPPKKQKNEQKPGSEDPAQADQTADPQATPGDANGSAAAGSDNSGQSAKPSSAADDNPFPEDVSRKAAQADGSSGSSDTPPPQSPNASPNAAVRNHRRQPTTIRFPKMSLKAAEADGSSGSGDTPATSRPMPRRIAVGNLRRRLTIRFRKVFPARRLTKRPTTPLRQGVALAPPLFPPPIRTSKEPEKAPTQLLVRCVPKRTPRSGISNLVKETSTALTSAIRKRPFGSDQHGCCLRLGGGGDAVEEILRSEHNYELDLQVVPTGSKAKHALKQLDQLARGK